MIHFTPTEERILNVLSDGLPHDRPELLACLNDSQSTIENLLPHITNIRSKLRLRGQTIVCELVNRKHFYRHIRLLTPEHVS